MCVCKGGGPLSGNPFFVLLSCSACSRERCPSSLVLPFYDALCFGFGLGSDSGFLSFLFFYFLC